MEMCLILFLISIVLFQDFINQHAAMLGRTEPTFNDLSEDDLRSLVTILSGSAAREDGEQTYESPWNVEGNAATTTTGSPSLEQEVNQSRRDFYQRMATSSQDSLDSNFESIEESVSESNQFTFGNDLRQMSPELEQQVIQEADLAHYSNEFQWSGLTSASEEDRDSIDQRMGAVAEPGHIVGPEVVAAPMPQLVEPVQGALVAAQPGEPAQIPVVNAVANMPEDVGDINAGNVDDLEIDVEGEPGIAEMLGFQGPIRAALVNALWLAIFNAVSITILLYVPFLIGRTCQILAFSAHRLLKTSLQFRLDSLIYDEANAEFDAAHPRHTYLLAQLWSCLPVIASGYLSVVIISLLSISVFDAVGGMLKMQRSEQANLFQSRLKRALNVVFLSFKVVLMFFVELVIFPISCGFLIDIATLPLFYGIASDTERSVLYPIDANWLSYLDEFIFSDRSINLILAPFLHPIVFGIVGRMDFHSYAPGKCNNVAYKMMIFSCVLGSALVHRCPVHVQLCKLCWHDSKFCSTGSPLVRGFYICYIIIHITQVYSRSE